MFHDRRWGIRPRATVAGVAALLACASSCMTYRGPRGVESLIERKAGVELRREMGFKLGPISTRCATSLVHHFADEDYRDLSGVGFAVFEVTERRGAGTQPITAKDLGAEGWQPMIESRSDGGQLLVLARPQGGEMREMLFLSIEDDEVVVARFKGHLDRLIDKTLAAADREGARGARAALGVESN